MKHASQNLFFRSWSHETMKCFAFVLRLFFFSTLFVLSYDNKNKELTSIPPLPGEGRIGFGLAATDNDQIISVGGHNFQYQTMSTVTMLDTNADKFVWEKLPDMPGELENTGRNTQYSGESSF